MKYFLRNALRTSLDYLIVLVIFLVFLYTFIAITGEHFTKWLPFYSAINFLILFFILYGDYRQLAIREKRPQYEIKTYPLKGVPLGLVGCVPIVALFIILSVIKTDDELLARLMEIAIDGVLGPLYFIANAIGNSPYAYAVAILMVPVIVTLGYLAGYYDFSLRNALSGKKEVNSKDKAFKPSPGIPPLNNRKEEKSKQKQKQRYGN